jgi:hypothetical protein
MFSDVDTDFYRYKLKYIISNHLEASTKSDVITKIVDVLPTTIDAFGSTLPVPVELIDLTITCIDLYGIESNPINVMITNILII